MTIPIYKPTTPTALSDYGHILTLGLNVLWLGGTNFLSMGWILDSRVRTANLLQDATSDEPKPGIFAIVRGIRARSGNDCCLTQDQNCYSFVR